MPSLGEAVGRPTYTDESSEKWTRCPRVSAPQEAIMEDHQHQALLTAEIREVRAACSAHRSSSSFLSRSEENHGSPLLQAERRLVCPCPDDPSLTTWQLCALPLPLPLRLCGFAHKPPALFALLGWAARHILHPTLTGPSLSPERELVWSLHATLVVGGVAGVKILKRFVVVARDDSAHGAPRSFQRDTSAAKSNLFSPDSLAATHQFLLASLSFHGLPRIKYLLHRPLPAKKGAHTNESGCRYIPSVVTIFSAVDMTVVISPLLRSISREPSILPSPCVLTIYHADHDPSPVSQGQRNQMKRAFFWTAQETSFVSTMSYPSCHASELEPPGHEVLQHPLQIAATDERIVASRVSPVSHVFLVHLPWMRRAATQRSTFNFNRDSQANGERHIDTVLCVLRERYNCGDHNEVIVAAVISRETISTGMKPDTAKQSTIDLLRKDQVTILALRPVPLTFRAINELRFPLCYATVMHNAQVTYNRLEYYMQFSPSDKSIVCQRRASKPEADSRGSESSSH
ncbi:hypothetical protein BC629DRAFT_1434310 [Irpex lacteus]|nr:hypothetical protein BC629DRAFT_1434310 [Irpex lacteus]